MVQDVARRLGIGVALHGAGDKRSGLLQFAPNIGWRDVAVGKTLDAPLAQAGLGEVPVHIHNEAALSAVSETESRKKPVDDPPVSISCGVGVGTGHQRIRAAQRTECSQNLAPLPPYCGSSGPLARCQRSSCASC